MDVDWRFFITGLLLYIICWATGYVSGYCDALETYQTVMEVF